MPWLMSPAVAWYFVPTNGPGRALQDGALALVDLAGEVVPRQPVLDLEVDAVAVHRVVDLAQRQAGRGRIRDRLARQLADALPLRTVWPHVSKSPAMPAENARQSTQPKRSPLRAGFCGWNFGR
jgi:hypothetical protein